jgi:hypothetical protein
MSSFGIPVIMLKISNLNGTSNMAVGLNQIGKKMEAVFPNKELAKQYEADIRTKISAALEAVRRRNDDFSSSEEVDI